MPEPSSLAAEAGAADLALLESSARQAGEIALGFFRQAPKAWEKPDAAGPVTEADLAVDSHLRQALTQARPEAGWLSEETADNTERLLREAVFIVDPIDGTRSFIDGAPDWAVSIALARAGRIAAAVVHLPARGLTYTATANGPALLNGTAIHAAPGRDIAGAEILTAKRNMDPVHWRDGAAPFTRKFRSSLAWRLALVAEGRFDGMLSLGAVWEWDVAAGVLIAERAGARVTTRSGAQPRFNTPARQLDGLIAAGAPLQARLIAALAAPQPATAGGGGDADPFGTV